MPGTKKLPFASSSPWGRLDRQCEQRHYHTEPMPPRCLDPGLTDLEVLYFSNTCVHIHVSMGVCSCVCVSTCVHEHTKVRRTKDNLDCPSPSAVHLLVLLCSETGSVAGLELAKWARRAGQWAPEILLSPYHQPWDYKSAPPYLAFAHGFWGSDSSLHGNCKHFTIQAVSSLPKASYFNKSIPWGCCGHAKKTISI